MDRAASSPESRCRCGSCPLPEERPTSPRPEDEHSRAGRPRPWPEQQQQQQHQQQHTDAGCGTSATSSYSECRSTRQANCGCGDALRQIRRPRSPSAERPARPAKRPQQRKRSASDVSYGVGSRAQALASKVRSRLASLCIPPYLATLLLLSYSLIGVADACSSRSTPKPRPPTPTPRPNITFHMYSCPPDYAEWYCLNGATCFTVKIVDSLLYNCLCSNGYIGQRCEFKDLDGTYLPSRQRVMLETASIAGAVTIAVFLAVITFISVYIHCKRKQKELRMMSSGVDAVDGPARDPELRPFCSRSRSLMIFMAKNPNSSTIGPSIEQTRMPNWNFPAETSTRLASVNENKRPSHH